jgi:hypothetical protein
MLETIKNIKYINLSMVDRERSNQVFDKLIIRGLFVRKESWVAQIEEKKPETRASLKLL